VKVTAASITGANPGEFAISGISFPVTINAGSSTPFTVTFTPGAAGSASATLSFTSSASNSPTAALTGTGTAAAQHWVDLTWNASTGAVTYNTYRKLPTDSNYTQINSGDTNTAYTDNNVTSGQTYDYVVTAVDGNGIESGYSNMTEALIP